MTKLTKAQKLMRPVINFLVERFFPNGLFFYGTSPLNAFDTIDQDQGDGFGTMASMALVNNAINANAGHLSIDLSGMTINGDPAGDWRVTVERLNAKDAAHD